MPLLLVAVILGIVTSFVKPVLTILSIPLIILTLGLFLLVINALMLMLTAGSPSARHRLPGQRLLAGGRRVDHHHAGHLGRSTASSGPSEQA